MARPTQREPVGVGAVRPTLAAEHDVVGLVAERDPAALRVPAPVAVARLHRREAARGGQPHRLDPPAGRRHQLRHAAQRLPASPAPPRAASATRAPGDVAAAIRATASWAASVGPAPQRASATARASSVAPTPWASAIHRASVPSDGPCRPSCSAAPTDSPSRTARSISGYMQQRAPEPARGAGTAGARARAPRARSPRRCRSARPTTPSSTSSAHARATVGVSPRSACCSASSRAIASPSEAGRGLLAPLPGARRQHRPLRPLVGAGQDLLRRHPIAPAGHDVVVDLAGRPRAPEADPRQPPGLADRDGVVAADLRRASAAGAGSGSVQSRSQAAWSATSTCPGRADRHRQRDRALGDGPLHEVERALDQADEVAEPGRAPVDALAAERGERAVAELRHVAALDPGEDEREVELEPHAGPEQLADAAPGPRRACSAPEGGAARGEASMPPLSRRAGLSRVVRT